MTGGRSAPESIPEWQIERHLLGELPDGEAAEVRAALERRADLRERLSALERSSSEILREHPPARVAAAVRLRLAASAPPRPSGSVARPAALGLALTAAVGVGATVLWLGRSTTPPGAAEVTREKGAAPRLLLYRRGGGSGVERLGPGARVRRDDVVQLAYRVVEGRHGVIVSIDGRGVVTRHLPATGPVAARLQPGGAVPLSQAYELDDAPGFERFVLVTAREPFPVETVLEALRRQASRAAWDWEARLDLPRAMDQFSLTLRKEPAR